MKVATHITTAIIAGVVSISGYVYHYDHTSSPAGQHCWNEINASQPTGVEKICMVNQ